MLFHVGVSVILWPTNFRYICASVCVCATLEFECGNRNSHAHALALLT